MVDLSSMSIEQLTALEGSIDAERVKRNTVENALGFLRNQTAVLEDIAARTGVVEFSAAPTYGHLPGQVVTLDGKKYKNVSGRPTRDAPGTKRDVWEVVA